MKMIEGGLRLLLCVFVALALSSGKEKSAFKLILLPDTQTYSSNYPEIFRSQTRWCAENSGDVAFVLQQGDITDNNSEQQWTVASEALSWMDGRVPYTFVPGNHDIGEGGRAEERDTELLNRFMPYEKYSRMSNFGGAFSKGKMDNTFHTFKAGGFNWLILSLEFGVRDTVLAWAATVVEKYPRHKVIINTHAYMYSDDTRMSRERDHKWLPQTYGLGKATGSETVNCGEQIWDKLVKNHSNIMFVFSGHVLNDGAGVLVSQGIHGNKVYQMLANFQGGVEGTQNGGNGFLRIITIDPENAVISVKTYSPHVYKYKTDPSHQFTFKDVNF